MLDLIKEGEVVNVFASNDNKNWEFIARTQYSKDLDIIHNKKYKYIQYTTGNEPMKLNQKFDKE